MKNLKRTEKLKDIFLYLNLIIVKICHIDFFVCMYVEMCVFEISCRCHDTLLLNILAQIF